MSLAAAPPANRGSLFRAGVVLVPLLLVVGGLSARFSGSTDDNDWFQTLALPALQPPGPVFPIAWTILYTVLGIAGAIIWSRKGARGRGLALTLFTIGIAINLTWSPVFFRFHLILPALVVIGVMWIVAVMTTFAFARVSRLAAWLLVPYVVWLSFAFALNARILVLNPTADAFQVGV